MASPEIIKTIIKFIKLIYDGIINVDLQEDVWNDKYDWKKELHNVIKKISASGTVMNIYLCKNDEYADHISL